MGAGRRNEHCNLGRLCRRLRRSFATGAGGYQLRGFPTVILFRNGEEVARFSGARTPQQVQAFLDQHLAAEAAHPIQP